MAGVGGGGGPDRVDPQALGELVDFLVVHGVTSSREQAF